MLRYGDGVVRIIIITSDLFHLQVTKNSTENDVKQLDTVGILDHARVRDGYRGNRAIGRPSHRDGDRLSRDNVRKK